MSRRSVPRPSPGKPEKHTVRRDVSAITNWWILASRACLLGCIIRLCESKRNRRVDENLVLLQTRLLLVGFIDILNRAFAEKIARQNEDANEAGRAVGRCLREDRIRAGLIPGFALGVGRRVTERVNANGALDEAADARPLMAMQISTAARWKGHAVAAPEDVALGQCCK